MNIASTAYAVLAIFAILILIIIIIMHRESSGLRQEIARQNADPIVDISAEAPHLSERAGPIPTRTTSEQAPHVRDDEEEASDSLEARQEREHSTDSEWENWQDRVDTHLENWRNQMAAR